MMTGWNNNTFFPTDWLTDVVVTRGHGRDKYGDPLPTTESYTLKDCVVGTGVMGSGSLNEANGLSDAVFTKVYVYAPARSNVRARDVIVVPKEHFMGGLYEVDGEVMAWPMGDQIEVRRVDGTSASEVHA